MPLEDELEPPDDVEDELELELDDELELELDDELEELLEEELDRPEEELVLLIFDPDELGAVVPPQPTINPAANKEAIHLPG